MFERRIAPLAPGRIFIRRLARSVVVAVVIVGLSLTMGVMGYHRLEGLSWLDSYVEAAMILSGMGPAATLHTTGGKLFAGTYALYSGLIIVISVGVMLAPILHRFLHKFHLEEESKKK